uniref:Uncharacterized protein n=1 Tax=Arundo donax TaxID=35708 RepID=A0A0A9GCD2_ARUDO
MHRSAPPAAPHPARTPTLAMYRCTSVRIRSCIAAIKSGLNGYDDGAAARGAAGGGGEGGEGEGGGGGSSWNWLWARSWWNPVSMPGSERESEVSGSSSCRRLIAQSAGSNPPDRATGR